jgi:transmembrane sensor
VMVYENWQGKTGKSVVLTPNQKVTQTHKQIDLPQLVEQPLIINPIEKKEDFIFEKTPLTTVLSRLTSVYAIDILIKNKTMNQCLFTGDLNGLTLNEQLDLICKTFDTHYQTYATAIWFDGESCL